MFIYIFTLLKEGVKYNQKEGEEKTHTFGRKNMNNKRERKGNLFQAKVRKGTNSVSLEQLMRYGFLLDGEYSFTNQGYLGGTTLS